MEKENWIDAVMQSTDGIHKAIPDKALFAAIQSRLKAVQTVPQHWVWLAAASLALLFVLNARIVSHKARSSKAATESLAETITASNQLY